MESQQTVQVDVFVNIQKKSTKTTRKLEKKPNLSLINDSARRINC